MPPRKRLRGVDGRFTKDVTPDPPLPASVQVLGTTELLEMIALALPMRDLLLAQRVCKSWRSLIISSIHLRRALFLEPVRCGDISYIDWRLDDKNFYDESHAQLGLGEHLRGPERDEKPRRYSAHWGKTRQDKGCYRIFVNPLLAKLFPALLLDNLYWYEQIDNLPKPAQYEHASWKSMFFTQPPVNCMAVEWDSATSEDEDGGRPIDWTITSISKIRVTKGITMQQLFSRLIEIDRPAWIEGSDHWEQYRGTEDLERVVVLSG